MINEDEYYYTKKEKKFFDFYEFFKILGGLSGLILLASFIYRLIEK
jgi:hypothetical protein